MRLAGEIVGGYTLVRTLGSGGQATVYLATDSKGTQVALKCLNANASEARERFVREVGLLEECEHPNIVKCLDYNLKKGSEWVALCYANGGTLDSWLGSSNSPDTRSLRDIFLPIAGALDYFGGLAADANEPQQHRDVKPSNILLHDGIPLLSDFGVAQKPGSHLTHAGVRIGTENYSAPEQLQNTSSGRVDQYALATIIYQWLAGRLPFLNAQEKLIQRAPDEPLVRRNIDVRARTALLKALAILPVDRYDSCVDFVTALIAAFEPIGGAETNPGGAAERDAFSKFSSAQEVYDSLSARLLQCQFHGAWVEGFKERFADHQSVHRLPSSFELKALVEWLRQAPPLHMKYLFFAIAKGLPIPAEKPTQTLALELLVFAACRQLNLEYFLAAPIRRVDDPNFGEAQVCEWPTSAASIAGLVRSALSGQTIVVDHQCTGAGAIPIELARFQSIDGQSEILALLYRELLGKSFRPDDLAADDEAARRKRIHAVWAPVRKELSDRALNGQSVALVLVPPEHDTLDPDERDATANHFARMVNTTLFQLRTEPAATHVLTESDLLLQIQQILDGLSPPNEARNSAVAALLP